MLNCLGVICRVILKERLAAVLDTVVVIASPFSRAVQTAVYASEALGIQEGDPNFRVWCV